MAFEFKRFSILGGPLNGAAQVAEMPKTDTATNKQQAIIDDTLARVDALEAK